MAFGIEDEADAGAALTGADDDRIEVAKGRDREGDRVGYVEAGVDLQARSGTGKIDQAAGEALIAARDDDVPAERPAGKPSLLAALARPWRGIGAAQPGQHGVEKPPEIADDLRRFRSGAGRRGAVAAVPVRRLADDKPGGERVRELRSLADDDRADGAVLGERHRVGGGEFVGGPGPIDDEGERRALAFDEADDAADAFQRLAPWRHRQDDHVRPGKHLAV